MRFSYTLFLTFVVTAITALLSGCTGGGSYSVYSGYGYPYYGHGVGYSRGYYDDDFDNRGERIENRREDRAERIDRMSPQQRQYASDRVRQSRPQRVERRQVRQATRPARNMGRPRMGGRRR